MYAPYTPCGEMFVRTILPFIPTSRRAKQYTRETTPGAIINRTHGDGESYTTNTIVDVTIPEYSRSRQSNLSPLERAHMKNSLQLTKDSTAVKVFRRCAERYGQFYEIRERNLQQAKDETINAHFLQMRKEQEAEDKRRLLRMQEMEGSTEPEVKRGGGEGRSGYQRPQ